MDIQKHPRESLETLPDSFLQNHNLVSSFTCRPWFNSYREQFYFKLEWLELAAGAPLDSCMLQAIREDCLNHKPFSISAIFFFVIPLGISFISCSYSPPSRWLAVNDYFPFCLQPFTAYFYIQRYSIGDVFRIEIKNHGVLLPKTLRESVMVTGYNWLFTLWWAKVPKEIIFLKDCCCKYSCGSQY